MSDSAPRLWCFHAEDFEDESFYLDAEGREIDCEDARDAPFVGDLTGAEREADRRADLWESREGGLLSRITYESLGLSRGKAAGK